MWYSKLWQLWDQQTHHKFKNNAITVKLHCDYKVIAQ